MICDDCPGGTDWEQRARAAYAVIRRYVDRWRDTRATEQPMWCKDSLRFEQWEPMSSAEVDAIRRARATQEETSHE